MPLNTLEESAKKTILCFGLFLTGLGLYMESQGQVPMVIGLITTTICIMDWIIEVKNG